MFFHNVRDVLDHERLIDVLRFADVVLPAPLSSFVEDDVARDDEAFRDGVIAA